VDVSRFTAFVLCVLITSMRHLSAFTPVPNRLSKDCKFYTSFLMRQPCGWIYCAFRKSIIILCVQFFAHLLPPPHKKQDYPELSPADPHSLQYLADTFQWPAYSIRADSKRLAMIAGSKPFFELQKKGRTLQSGPPRRRFNFRRKVVRSVVFSKKPPSAPSLRAGRETGAL
jgi:hypothetical protein